MILENGYFMRNKFIIFILALLGAMSIHAGPAMKGDIYLRQPDGTFFAARFMGDEFVRIKTTGDGCAIVQEADGWWYYAVYDVAGDKSSSGWRVGSNAPQQVLDESRNIPVELLMQSASDKRAHVSDDGEPVSILKRIRPETRSGDEGTVVKHVLVILAEFRDVPFRYGRDSFVRLLTEEGYSDNGATGSAKQYFDAQFNGDVVFDFSVSPVVTLSKIRAYYGANDAGGDDMAPAEMISDACKKADSYIDFSKFDDDGDGVVDNVFVFYSGQDEAEGADEECIWSHAWYIRSGAGINLTLDGKKIDRYACTSELSRRYDHGLVLDVMNGIGTFCHEYAHTLGLPDFYDTDYDKQGGWAAGLWGSTSLMDSGNQNNDGNTPPYFNSVEREILGIAEPVMLEETGVYSMPPIHENNSFYRLDTDTEGEYYLFECRKEEGWDLYIGGSGMLVYHVDKSDGVLQKWNYKNTVNSERDHQCVDLMEADLRNDGFANDNEYINLMRNIRGIFFPTYDVDSITPEGRPSLTSWNGASLPMSISGIRRSDDGVTFNFIDMQDDAPPVASDLQVETFPFAAIIRFETGSDHIGKARIKWGRTGQQASMLELEPYAPGKYALILDGLEPTGKTYTVEVSFVSGKVEGESRSISFMTKSRPPVKWPFMHLEVNGRNADGSFTSGSRIPFVLSNASEAEEVRWYMNSREVTHEGDGYFTLNESGELKAVVFWSDGSTDMIIKNITIK